jgi:hypothetical protein
MQPSTPDNMQIEMSRGFTGFRSRRNKHTECSLLCGALFAFSFFDCNFFVDKFDLVSTTLIKIAHNNPEHLSLL